MQGPWTRDEASASGQVFEDRVWALLMEQSRGHLHVFRPLLDRGVDALLHRLADGTYIPVQAKGRSSLRGLSSSSNNRPALQFVYQITFSAN